MPRPEHPFLFDINFSLSTDSIFTEVDTEGAGDAPFIDTMISEIGEYMLTEAASDHMTTE
jgi:hypothetical protein